MKKMEVRKISPAYKATCQYVEELGFRSRSV